MERMLFCCYVNFAEHLTKRYSFYARFLMISLRFLKLTEYKSADIVRDVIVNPYTGFGRLDNEKCMVERRSIVKNRIYMASRIAT